MAGIFFTKQFTVGVLSLKEKSWPHSLAAPLNSVAGLRGWALWLGLVLLLAASLDSVNSVAGLCGWALSSSCSPRGRAPELLCGWALSSSWPRPWTLSTLWLGSVAGPCPPLVLLVAAPLNSVNSVAGLCGWALSSSCPPLGRAPELCRLCGFVAGPCPLGRAPELCGWALWRTL